MTRQIEAGCFPTAWMTFLVGPPVDDPPWLWLLQRTDVASVSLSADGQGYPRIARNGIGESMAKVPAPRRRLWKGIQGLCASRRSGYGAACLKLKG
jgi:hypothetical protein